MTNNLHGKDPGRRTGFYQKTALPRQEPALQQAVQDYKSHYQAKSQQPA